MVKNLPAMQQTWVWSLGQEDTLEMEMVTHSRIIAWEIPWTEESGRLQSMVLQRVEKDWVTNTFTFTVLIVLLLLFSHSALSNTFQTYALHTPGFPVLHHFLELAQTHVHWVGDAIQPSHPLLSPSPPAQNLSQHQGLFQWVSSSHQVAKVLELQFQHESFSEYSGLISFRFGWSPCSPRDSQESSPTPQFKSINSSVLGLLYGPTFKSIHDYWEKHSFDWMNLCWQNNVSAF